MQFPSAQQFDVVVTNEEKQEIWRWSLENDFPQFKSWLMLEPQQEQSKRLVWPTRIPASGALILPGLYFVTVSMEGHSSIRTTKTLDLR